MTAAAPRRAQADGIAGIAAEDRKAAYLRDGFVVVRGLINPTRLADLNRRMGELYVLQLDRLGLPARRDGGREAFQENARRLLDVDVGIYISTARLTQMLPAAHALMIDAAILDVARELGVALPVISTRVSNHIMSDVLKIPGGYHKSPPHQDWRSMQGSLDSLVYWVPTTEVTLRSHPLEVIPGSHRLGLLATAEHVMTPAVDDPRASEDAYVGLPMSPGDVAFFSAFLVHRTGEQGDGRVRIAFSGRLNNAAEPTYMRRGYPTPYKYSYQTELITPDFPHEADVAAVFPPAG